MSELRLDGVGLQLLWSRLTGVADEMWTSVRRTAVSTIIGAAQDFGCEVLAADGSSLAHATRSMPAFNMVMPALTRAVMAVHPPETMRAGDVFITNDPWICCGHLDDIAVVTPVVHHGAVVAFTATAAHASSIGGALARHRVHDVYEEGLQIPITKLRAQGHSDATAWDFIRANVRVPEMVLTDIEAEIAANQVGVDRLLEVLDEYTLDDLSAVTNAVQRVSREAMGVAIGRLPDADHAAHLEVRTGAGPIGLRVAISVRGAQMRVDYAGSDGQRLAHGLNCPYEYTRAHTVYAMQCLLAPEVPANEGTIRSIEVAVPDRSVLACRPPASVGNRMRIGWHIHRLLFDALQDATPDRVQAGNGLMHIVRLQAENGDGEVQGVHLIAAGGRGAGKDRPGRGRDCFPSSARSVPLEELEARAPVLFTRRALRDDFAGDGVWPGAAGQEIELIRAPGFDGRLTAFVDADYLHAGPTGVQGGADGERFSVLRGGEVVPAAEVGTAGIDVPAGPNRLTLHVPGGGGYGPPVRAEPVPAVARPRWLGAASTSEARVAAWVAEYGRAWREHDFHNVADLFTPDGIYRSAPFREPHVGSAEIRRYWREEPGTHENIDLRFGAPVVAGHRAVVEWWLQVCQGGQEMTGPGCLILRFAADGRCEELREYWDEAEGRREPPSTWGR